MRGFLVRDFMYYLVYKTVNLLNNKFYIGSHQTLNINDGYLGSGVILKKAIKKHGRQNFRREIIANCISTEVSRTVETHLVRYYLDNHKRLCYNISYSGTGAMLGEANAFYGRSHSDETKRILSEKASQKTGERNPMFGKKHTKEYKIRSSNARKGKNKTNDLTIAIRSWNQSTGWWCTPVGCFVSDRDAALFANIGRNSIRSWCKNPEHFVRGNYQIPEEYWGRTWRENGFWFKEK